MPISPIVLQRRHAELGRIRLGAKNPKKGFPMKLTAFRFTSPSQRYITDLAALYGGECQQWDNNGKAEWEVYTTADSIPVIAVKGGLSQWMETWSGGGCVHRCDGERAVDGTYCNPEDPAHVAAKPTTRLSLMLPELEAIGVWRMESHGWNAAAEIPAVAELAQYVGDLVPAHLHLVERRTIKDGQTSRFVVPVLDLQIGTERLKQIAAEKSGQAVPAQLPGGQAPQIEAPARDYTDAVVEATTTDELRMLWRAAGEHGALTEPLERLIKQRVGELQAPEAGDAPAGSDAAGQVEPATPASGPTSDGDDVDTAWIQLQTAAGKAGVGDSNLRALLEQEYAQPVDDLDAQQLLDFIPKVGDAA